jgi:hypothetical protein
MAFGLQMGYSGVTFSSVFVYMLVFQSRLGPITWIILLQIVSSELINIPVATHWVLNLLISQFFPILSKPAWLGEPTMFYLSAGITAVFCGCNFWLIKETKGLAKEKAIEKYVNLQVQKTIERDGEVDPLLITGESPKD